VTPKHVEKIFSEADKLLSPVRGVVIHRSPAWFMVDGGKKTLEPVGMKGTELKALVSFVVSDTFFLDDVMARLRDMNITVSGFFSSSTGEAMLYLLEEDRDRTAILIDVGYLCTDVMAVEGDERAVYVLADGVSGCAAGGAGARLVCERLCDRLLHPTLALFDESLDDGDAGKALLGEIRQPGVGLLAGIPSLGQLLAHDGSGHQQESHGDQGQQGQHMVHLPHIEHRQRAQQHSVKEHHDAPAEALLHRVQIVGEQAHEAAHLVDLIVFPA
jgi:hypothetical protein